MQVIGALLAVALLVAPAATWAGIALSLWLPYPVSFFITALSTLTYLGVRALPVARAALR